tara:strand:- start:23 stop:463 length:441 start_codon:yes stop_codon:yes gene_type:complete
MIDMKILIIALTIFAVGCATAIPNRTVTLLGSGGELYQGVLAYDGPYSGTLTFNEGPQGESFSGRYIVVDKTSMKRSSGDLIAPSNGTIPVIGTASSSESGEVSAEGVYIAKSKSGHIKCEISVGAQGHGKGTCAHSSGSTYDIIL